MEIVKTLVCRQFVCRIYSYFIDNRIHRTHTGDCYKYQVGLCY